MKNDECQTRHMTYQLTLCFSQDGLPVCPFSMLASYSSWPTSVHPLQPSLFFLLKQPSWHSQLPIHFLQLSSFSYHSASSTKQTTSTGTFSYQNALNTTSDEFRSIWVLKYHCTIGVFLARNFNSLLLSLNAYSGNFIRNSVFLIPIVFFHWPQMGLATWSLCETVDEWTHNCAYDLTLAFLWFTDQQKLLVWRLVHHINNWKGSLNRVVAKWELNIVNSI